MVLVVAQAPGVPSQIARGYTTTAAVRSFGGGIGKDDAIVQDAIDIAGAIIDGYTGKTFASFPPSTYVKNDVRKPLVVLPSPFASITQVLLNNVEIPTAGYIIDSWGIRLYWPGHLDIDGFPRRAGLLPGDNRLVTGGPYGSQVAVTATFGYATVPTQVARAATILASRTVGGTSNDLAPDPWMKAEKIGPYSVTYQDALKTPVLNTTGDVQADRLLRGFRSVDAMVG